MQRRTPARIVIGACAITALLGCDRSLERIAGPGGPARIPICDEFTCDQPAPSGVAGRFGVVIHDNATAAELQALGDLHVNLVRLTVDWGHERLIPGWADLQMQQLHADGIDVLANVAYRYRYEAVPGGGDYAHCANYPAYACIPTGAAWNAFYQDWVAYVNQLVSANHQYAKYWSAWNEPNEAAFFNGTPSQYDSLAKALCDAVQATRVATGDTQLYCVGPDLAIHRADEFKPNEYDWLQERMLAVNFDIISIHWYQSLADVRAKASYVKSRFPGKPVWVTETGIADPTWRPAAADPEFQERDLVAKWRDLQTGSSPIDGLFYFDLQSVPNGITQDFNPRPAYYALKRLAEASYADPIPGNCSTANGSALCAYTSWIPEGYGCRMDVYARNSMGQPVIGVTIAANEATAPWGYQELGTRKTNAAGVASFTAHCDRDHTARFVTGAGFVLKNWWAPTTSPAMHPTSGNIGLYTFIVAP